MLEIERKFLVEGNYKHLATEKFKIVQGYLSSIPERTVRVRIQADKAFLTIKGKSSKSGLSRFEWEKEIALIEAEKLIELCEVGIIAKTRHIIHFEGKTYEVDEFYDDNEGLTLAEIELNTENEQFIKPPWLGLEVSTDIRYYNSYLSKNGYKYWDKKQRISK
jgi:adenylate cyclase